MDYNLPQQRPGQAYVWYMPEDSPTRPRTISLDYDYVIFSMPFDEMMHEIRSRHFDRKRDPKIKRIIRKIRELRNALAKYYEIDRTKNKKLISKRRISWLGEQSSQQKQPDPPYLQL
jgi:hypothetical protein